MIDTLEPTPTLEKDFTFTERIAAAHEHAALHTNGHPEAFRDLRERARAAFDALGIPGRKDEAWKYTNIERALRHDYALLDPDAAAVSAEDVADLRIEGLDASTLVVVNGVVDLGLSDLGALPDGVTVGSLREAGESVHAQAVQRAFGQYANAEEDAFIALNTSFELDGVFLQVERGVTVERPVQIIHVTDADRDAFVQTRNLYLFGENCEALVVETYHSAGGAKTFGNRVSEIVVEREARASVLQLQTEGADASQVNTLQVYQEEKSYFAAHTYTLGGALVRNNINAVPNGEHCETHLYGLYILDGQQHVDNHTLVDHAKPNCFSNELYRGIVDDRSTGVFNGKVFVRRDAQQTNAYQSSQGVVLSDSASHHSKPELEIYADDVKCSHGSTTGEVEPEHVFYLRSRGLSEQQAKSLLLYAFAHDIVTELPHEALRTYLDDLIEVRLNAQLLRD
ncbi:MAG: Fe-S cluster assembly protein SufD [Bacteroidota bacterium]